jgi:hypothetical protein
MDASGANDTRNLGDTYLFGGGRLRGEVSSRRETIIADVGDENVLAVLDGLLLVQGNIRIAAGLIQSMTCHGAFLMRWGGVSESRRCCLHR